VCIMLTEFEEVTELNEITRLGLFEQGELTVLSARPRGKLKSKLRFLIMEEGISSSDESEAVGESRGEPKLGDE